MYRGISGGVLPDEFWQPNEFNVCGGVEFAFTSTTTDEDVARRYARNGKVGMIMSISMGMVDRGAELQWLSQYPAEQEICFAPLTGVEVQGTRVDGSVLVVEARLSVNLTALTIEEVVAKMQRSQVQLLGNMLTELRFAGAPMPALAPLAALRSELLKREPSHFNDAENFKEATTQALDVQREVFGLLSEERSWLGSEEEEEGEQASRSDDVLSVRVREVMIIGSEASMQVVVEAKLLDTAPSRSSPLLLNSVKNQHEIVQAETPAVRSSILSRRSTCVLIQTSSS